MDVPDSLVISLRFLGDFKRNLTPAGIVDTMVASHHD